MLRTTPFTGNARPSGRASISVHPAAVRCQLGTLLSLSLVYCLFGSLIPGTLFIKPSAIGTQRRRFFVASPSAPRFCPGAGLLLFSAF